jgi:hypothetical protein
VWLVAIYPRYPATEQGTFPSESLQTVLLVSEYSSVRWEDRFAAELGCRCSYCFSYLTAFEPSNQKLSWHSIGSTCCRLSTTYHGAGMLSFIRCASVQVVALPHTRGFCIVCVKLLYGKVIFYAVPPCRSDAIFNSCVVQDQRVIACRRNVPLSQPSNIRVSRTVQHVGH